MDKRLQHHIWSKSDDNYVRENYAHSYASCVSIGNKLGELSPRSVEARAGFLRLTRDTRAFWTDKDGKKLIDFAGKYPIAIIAKKMGRTEGSVSCKMKRLGLINRHRIDCYSLSDLVVVLGMGREKILNFIESGKLKATNNDPKERIGIRWHIEEKDLIKFIRKYPSVLQGRNVDMLWLVDILAGILPINGKNGIRE